MKFNAMFVLPIAAVLVAAKQAQPVAPVQPALPIVAPAEIAADPSNRLTLDLSTGGRVVIQLRPDAAPQTVERMRTLVNQGFYNGLAFHRVIPGFMAQGGDPKGDGTGGSPLPDLKAEFNTLPHLRGTVAAARAESPDRANSQFYIMFAPRVSLDGKYTVFGRVIEGMPAVDQIAQGEPPPAPTTIVRATIGASPAPLPAPAPAPAPVQPAAPAEAPVPTGN